MATNDQVQSLYIAYFGRPADSEGLKFWTADTTTALGTIADGFAGTPEYKAATAGESISAIVNGFYQSLFNRSAELDGLNFWVEQITKGNTTTQEVGVVIAEAARKGPDNSDKVAIDSKIDASDKWTAETAKTTGGVIAYSGPEGVAAGVDFLTPVTTKATIPSDAATAAAVTLLIAGNSGLNSDTLNLTVLQDVADSSSYTQLSGLGAVVSTNAFKFDSTNQTVNATATTFSGVAGADSLVDGFSTDNDVLNLTGVTNVNIIGDGTGGAAATIAGIETINVTLSGATNTGRFNQGSAMVFTGSNTLNLGGSLANGQTVTFTAGDAGNGSFTTVSASGVTGNAATVVINGDASGETITGSTTVSNQLTGNAGVDTLVGGAASDTLTGGTANDTMTGGGGVDTFAKNFTTDGIDDLVDFAAGATGDVMGFTGFGTAFAGLTQTNGVAASAVADATAIVLTGTGAGSVVNVTANAMANIATAFNATAGGGAGDALYIFNADTTGNGAADEVQAWVLTAAGAGAYGAGDTAVQTYHINNIAAGTDLNNVFNAANFSFA